MQPTERAESTEKLSKDLFGFDRRTYILKNCCVPKPIGCGMPIAAHPFTDQLSIKEYSITGLCQACQDRIFKSEG